MCVGRKIAPETRADRLMPVSGKVADFQRDDKTVTKLIRYSDRLIFRDGASRIGVIRSGRVVQQVLPPVSLSLAPLSLIT